MLNIAEQIITICKNDPVLSATNPAGPSITHADATKTIPWMVIVWLPGTRILRSFDGTKIPDYIVSFTIVAPSATQAMTMLDRLEVLFDETEFALPNGDYCLQALLNKPPTIREGQRQSNNQPAYAATAVYKFRVQESA
ncbi:MAG TPA: hypothetical protein VMG59_06420 [Phycisphaerae bacterium]|nr:hypothetical protein [Phycisphaerae bacterium]